MVGAPKRRLVIVQVGICVVLGLLGTGLAFLLLFVVEWADRLWLGSRLVERVHEVIRDKEGIKLFFPNEWPWTWDSVFFLVIGYR